jgi:type II secretory pathway component GspD/PulD (secretin)
MGVPQAHVASGRQVSVAFQEQRNYIRGTSNQGTEVLLQIAPLSTGVTLNLQATRAADGRGVDASMHLKNSRLLGIDNFRPSGERQGFVQVPRVMTMELSAAAAIPEDRVLVLCGPAMLEEITREQRVPGLSDIPLIGNAFISRKQVNEERVLVVLIHATVNQEPPTTGAPTARQEKATDTALRKTRQSLDLQDHKGGAL